MSTTIFHLYIFQTTSGIHLCQTTYVKHLCQPPSQTICCGALRGRRGTRSHEHSFCVAGVTRHLWHWVVPLHRINRAKHRGSFRSRRGNQKSFILVLRERCSAYGTGREELTIGEINFQAWHFWHWMGRLDRIKAVIQVCLFSNNVFTFVLIFFCGFITYMLFRYILWFFRHIIFRPNFYFGSFFIWPYFASENSIFRHILFFALIIYFSIVFIYVIL